MRPGTNLEFGGGDSTAEELIPQVEHEPDSGGYTTDRDNPLSSGLDGENDVGRETERWHSICFVNVN